MKRYKITVCLKDNKFIDVEVDTEADVKTDIGNAMVVAGAKYLLLGQYIIDVSEIKWIRTQTDDNVELITESGEDK